MYGVLGMTSSRVPEPIRNCGRLAAIEKTARLLPCPWAASSPPRDRDRNPGGDETTTARASGCEVEPVRAKRGSPKYLVSASTESSHTQVCKKGVMGQGTKSLRDSPLRGPILQSYGGQLHTNLGDREMAWAARRTETRRFPRWLVAVVLTPTALAGIGIAAGWLMRRARLPVLDGSVRGNGLCDALGVSTISGGDRGDVPCRGSAELDLMSRSRRHAHKNVGCPCPRD
jgi:hypothetical protein